MYINVQEKNVNSMHTDVNWEEAIGGISDDRKLKNCTRILWGWLIE